MGTKTFAFFAVGLLLAGCEAGKSFRLIHFAAKNTESHEVCYKVEKPEKLVGTYCLKYLPSE